MDRGQPLRSGGGDVGGGQAGSPAIAAASVPIAGPTAATATRKRKLHLGRPRPPQPQPQQRQQQHVAPRSSSVPPPVYRYCRDGTARRRLADGNPSAATVVSPPLLSSEKAGQAYVLLDPIAGLHTAKGHTEQVFLAAPILVMSSCLHDHDRGNKSLPQGPELCAAAGTCHGRPSGGDVLFRPHPTKRVAIKRIARSWIRTMAAESSRGGPVGELAALRLLAASGEHPHVMPLIDVMVDDHFVYIIFPYADGGELFSLVATLAGENGLPEAEARKYLVQMVAGLRHLKRHGLAHGDVSLENVVLCKAPRACARERETGSSSEPAAAAAAVYDCRLIDFGLCRRMPEREGTPLAGRLLGGKAAYMAPEVAHGTVRDWHASDVWSLGVCLYNLLTGMRLYSHPRDRAFALLQLEGGARRILCHHIAVLGVSLSAGAAHLIASMLHPMPEARPTLEEVLVHPWLAGAVLEERM